MFAARTNQENAIYEQQTAAAAKPLNQGIKGLAPKTPGNQLPKTPFRGGKNDENRTLNFGKTGGKDGKADRNAFVTPANPRARAPLGNKTTNGKALLTPALGGAGKIDAAGSNKLTSPRQRRPKIKVHESTSVTAENVLLQETEEREIEYMPPRGIPLPDHDDDLLAAELDFTVLQGKNLTRGWYSEYASKKEDNEEDSELSDYEERIKEIEQAQKRKAETKKPRPATAQSSRGVRAAPGTIKAQHAASALSTQPAKSTFASSTSAARARQPALAPTSFLKKKSVAPLANNPRFTAAKVASNNTIGYSRGRVVSASTRGPLVNVHAKPSMARDEPEERTSLADLLGLKTLHVDDDDDAELALSGQTNMLDPLAGEEEDDVFQLDAVQDI
ncbi:unnamed protein product [Zymoseptoria tritici ST99CH_3D1]|nr:unnamed protein product [Zymoseptoria tritici ST99CH_3D1]